MEIRRAKAHDSEAIAEILRVAFGAISSEYTPEAFVEVTPSAELISQRFEEGPLWVADKDGRLVGTVSAVAEPEWLYIRSMAVLPEAQGLGVGFGLMREVEKYAVENGFERLFLYTTLSSRPAHRLYQKLGFYVVRETTAEEWFGTPGLAMEKLIGRKLENAIGS